MIPFVPPMMSQHASPYTSIVSPTDPISIILFSVVVAAVVIFTFITVYESLIRHTQ
jgi:hypothetical protein